MKYIQLSPSRFCGPFVYGAQKLLVALLCSVSLACVGVSACLANVSCGAVAAFDLVYRSLSVLWFHFVLDVG